MLFRSRENIVVSNVGCLELKGFGEMISAFNEFRGDAHVRLRHMGYARLPICIMRVSL